MSSKNSPLSGTQTDKGDSDEQTGSAVQEGLAHQILRMNSAFMASLVYSV